MSIESIEPSTPPGPISTASREVAPIKRKTTRSKSKIQRSVGTKSKGKRSTSKKVKSKKRTKRK
jgi:hypothetical protein